MNEGSIGHNGVEGDLADLLLHIVPLGIVLLNENLNVMYCNKEGCDFMKTYGLPEEVNRTGERMFNALKWSRLNNYFPGEVSIEKALGKPSKNWLLRLNVIHHVRPSIVVFIVEKSISNPLDMNEIRLRYNLTRRHIDVLKRVLNGFNNKDIAAELGITEQTVKDHLSRIYAKIGVGNRKDLIRLFMIK